MQLNKKLLSERDICTKYITPAIEKAGWDQYKQLPKSRWLSPGLSPEQPNISLPELLMHAKGPLAGSSATIGHFKFYRRLGHLVTATPVATVFYTKSQKFDDVWVTNNGARHLGKSP